MSGNAWCGPGRKIGVGEKLLSSGSSGEFRRKWSSGEEFGERRIRFELAVGFLGIARADWAMCRCRLTSTGRIGRVIGNAIRRSMRGSEDRWPRPRQGCISRRKCWRGLASGALRRRRSRFMSGWEHFSRCAWSGWKTTDCIARLMRSQTRRRRRLIGALEARTESGGGGDDDGADAGVRCGAIGHGQMSKRAAAKRTFLSIRDTSFGWWGRC